jgi:ribonuclease HIII
VNPEETALSHRLREFALAGGESAEDARRIVASALSANELSTITASRAAEVMERNPGILGEVFAPRIDEFREHLANQIELLRAVDALGDPDTTPRRVLDFAAAEEGQLEISSIDFEALHSARIRGDHRPNGAKRLLDEFGWERLDPAIVPELRGVVDELASRADDFQAEALFVDDARERGYVLGVQVHADPADGIRPHVEVGQVMRQQAEIALAKALPAGSGAEWNIEWPLQFDGASIGLALHLAALVARGEMRADPLLAATGEIDMNENIRGVMGIAPKLDAARRRGIKRVILPEANRAEAESSEAARDPNLRLIFVSRTGEIAAALAQVSAEPAMLHADRVIACRKRIPLYGLGIRNEHELANAVRFEVGDAEGQAAIDVYTGSKGTVRATGKDGSALRKAQKLVDENFPSEETPSHPPLPFNVPDQPTERRIHDALVDAGAAALSAAQGQSFAFRLTRGASGATVVVYSSGRAVLQAGKDPAYAEARTLLDQALGSVGGLKVVDPPAAANASAAASMSFDEPHIGTDESGKGDYFGPLVSAAVFTDRDTAQALAELGVRDSKKLTDKSVRKLAAEVKRVAQGRYAITRIGPERFNTLFAQMRSEGKNMNTLLAWGHARSIEDLLASGVKAKFVIVDQFADARYMEEKILADTRESRMEFMLFPKAEADIAVAAASILARDNFLDWLEQESRRLGIALPKGASDQVIAAAREIVARHGAERLQSLAKVSFKTTQKVLAP